MIYTKILSFVDVHPRWAALLCGVMAAFALPPLHIFPLLIPAYSGFYIALHKAQTKRQGFIIGWLFGLGYFVSGLYWLGYAMLVEAEKFAWMIPFAVLGLPSILALYYGLLGAIWSAVKRLLTGKELISIILFCLLFVLIEFLRSILFTGFPWNLSGYSWGFSLVMSQSAYIVGVWGVTLLTLWMATLPAILKFSCGQKEKVTALAICLFMLVMPFSYGYWRLQEHPTQYTTKKILLVQGNIPQQHKWDPQKQYDILDRYRKLSKLSEDEEGGVIIIWPETSYPYFLEGKSPPLEWVTSVMSDDAVLITGAMRADWNKNRQGIKAIYNSLHIVSPQAEVLAEYDKVRLVPFGEFVPFRSILPMKKITHGMQDFGRGKGAEVLKVQGVPPFQPLICYEVIFPEYKAAEDSDWLLNITNDAWFGDSSGPYQHLTMARFRAIEQGKPVVRAANTGVSAVYDALGRELGRIELNQIGTIKLNLPSKLPIN